MPRGRGTCGEGEQGSSSGGSYVEGRIVGMGCGAGHIDEFC